jgi:arginyl-tRNA--protein-N-Asp/Glu arginylyltransferase
MSSQNIHLYLTSEHDCGYLPDRMATNLVPDPTRQMDIELYSQLIQLGYRRSGDFTYRPHCNDCAECQPCRIPANNFTPNRSQRRCLRDNQDLTTNIVKAEYNDEHFKLYQSYINSRHSDGSMVNPEPKDFSNFLYSPWSNTHFLEVRKDNHLIAVAAIDYTDSALSAVYCYFDPEESTRSLGTYCILQQVQQTKAMGLDYLYMGYWIKDCQKMRYKAYFQPMEILVDNTWKTMDASD